LLNRVQFLPNAHVITVRGCKAGSFSGVPDAYRYFLAGGGGAQPGPEAQPEGSAGLPSDFDLAHPGVLSLLEQVVRKKLQWPVIGFELESGGFVAATAEAAWPDSRIAVISQEMAADQETFLQAAWQVFLFGPDGLAAKETTGLISILPSQS